MYTENTGSNKPSDVLDLLKMVYEKKASIIACAKAEVYGNAEVTIGGDAMGMYQQIWRAFGKKATHAAYDWTVKADADAVLSLGKHGACPSPSCPCNWCIPYQL